MPRWLSIGLRLAGTVGALAYIATKVDLDAAGGAIGRISAAAFAVAIALVALNVVAGALRWKVALRAYGAPEIPGFGELVRRYFVAFFYNTYLPGAVAGDVARGVVTRASFGERGATGALAVVLVERALGLFALFALLAIGLVIAGGRLDGTRALWWWTLIGGAGSLGLVVAIALARRIAPHLPGRLGEIAGRIPPLVDRRAFAGAVGLSLVTQLCVAAAGWVLLAALAPIDFASSLLVVPLAAATAFLPITVGGAGAREAVYVALCGTLFHLPVADALAASLALWLAHLVVGAAGGAVQLVQLLRRRSA